MPEWLQQTWENVLPWMAWMVTGCLLLVGLAGSVIPVIPGHLILILAVVGHRLMLGREGSGVEWWTFVVLGVLAAISQGFEFAAGAAGAKWFGGTKWGAAGALAGGIVGMLFMPIGLIAGPLLGAILFEMAFAKQETKPALQSGVGSAVGTVAGMGIKIAIGVLMVVWFLVDVWWVK